MNENREMTVTSVVLGCLLAVVFGAALAVIVLLAVLPIVPVGLGGALLVALFGFFFAAVSARMVGFVGSSNNPVSGMAIATLVVAALAAVLIVCRVPVMPFAIGLYLPVQMMAMIFVGGLARLAVDRRSADLSAKGVLLSAGMIAGEGLCGILLAVLTLVLS